MSTVKPIPKVLLPSKMTVKVPIDGEYGGEYGEPVTVTHVRYDKATDLKRTDYVLEDGSKGLVFMDSMTSGGAFEVPVGSLIEINGEELAAVKVTPYETYNGCVHHWEIEVA